MFKNDSKVYVNKTLNHFVYVCVRVHGIYVRDSCMSYICVVMCYNQVCMYV